MINLHQEFLLVLVGYYISKPDDVPVFMLKLMFVQDVQPLVKIRPNAVVKSGNHRKVRLFFTFSQFNRGTGKVIFRRVLSEVSLVTKG